MYTFHNSYFVFFCKFCNLGTFIFCIFYIFYIFCIFCIFSKNPKCWILSVRTLHVVFTPTRNYMRLFVRATCAPSMYIYVIILETLFNRKESRLKYFIGGLSVVRLVMLCLFVFVYVFPLYVYLYE